MSTLWDTKKVKGQHVITVTADSAGAVGETNEGNNASTLAVTVKGNKVRTAPSRSRTLGQRARRLVELRHDELRRQRHRRLDGGDDERRRAAPPTFTSAPFAVAPGETLDVTAAVRASGAATAPTVGLAFLSPLGTVVATANALVAPLTTSGFATLAKTVTVPLGVASARVVLTARAPGRSRSTTWRSSRSSA